MPVATPVDTMPPQCEVRLYDKPLFADKNRTAKIKLPPGAKIRHCTSPADGSQIVTAPESGGTTMCVIYEYSVDNKVTDVALRSERTGAALSRPDKSCPPLDLSRQGYPGKDYFFMSDNLPLPNALKVKEAVEKGGLAFMNQEKASLKDRAGINYGTTPLQVLSIAPTFEVECRRNASFFEGRHAACYRAEVYNQTIRGNWWLIVGLTQKNEYKILQSTRTPAPVKGRTDR